MLQVIQTLLGVSRSNLEIIEEDEDYEIDFETSEPNSITPRESPVAEKITIHVGGTQFYTRKSILLREKDTLFSTLLKDQNQSELYIGRDPSHFQIILNHLKGGLDIVPVFFRLSDEQHLALLEDAKFYRIQSLIELLEIMLSQNRTWVFDIHAKNAAVMLSNDNLTANGSSAISGYPVIGNIALSEGVHSWRLKIDVMGSLMIGVCVKEDMDFDDEDFDKVWAVCYNPSTPIVYIFSKGVQTPTEDALRVRRGKPIEVCLNCDKGILKVNGVVIENLPKRPLYPVFLLGKNTKITLLD
jgi:hypothetical protein